MGGMYLGKCKEHYCRSYMYSEKKINMSGDVAKWYSACLACSRPLGMISITTKKEINTVDLMLSNYLRVIQILTRVKSS
jgi:hypothetical protein